MVLTTGFLHTKSKQKAQVHLSGHQDIFLPTKYREQTVSTSQRKNAKYKRKALSN